MKKLSVKTKLTGWLTLLMLLLASLLLAFLLSISRKVAFETAISQLSQVVQSNLDQIDASGGRFELGSDFSFYRNGVSTLIYSQKEALLAGQIPVFFAGEEAFRDRIIRKVPAEKGQYLVVDVWIPMERENGIWVRGILEAPENTLLVRNLFLVAFIALPFFIALVALGSYLIVKRAFRPLDHITETAVAINEAKDLFRRIHLSSGSDEFCRLADTFDELFGRLERSFEAEKQFAADASHELRTPVSIIKGACEYAEKYDETAEERQETISMIHRQALKMSDLISKLLSMTRLEQGTESAHMEALDFGELLHSVCEAQGYDRDRLLLTIPEQIIVMADSVLLSQLVRNLIENAFKYGKSEGHVWVSLEKSEKEILLRVRDDGIGIPAEEQEKIWKRFYQVDVSHSKEGGAGLGLALVQQIARLHGGYMTLESEPDSGSTFALHLPVAEKTEESIKKN